MSLPLAKKKRIIRIIIILSGRAEASESENTASEGFADALTLAKPILYSFPSNEGEWSSEQNDAWNSFVSAETALDPNGMGDVNETDVMNMMGDFQEAIDEC